MNNWRKSVGCVTLAMACVLAVGWVRSCYSNTLDEITLAVGPTDDWTAISIASGDQKLGVLCMKNRNITWGAPRFGWDTYSVSPEAAAWTEQLGWIWGPAGFGVVDLWESESLFNKGVAAPYWAIVFPLILLSAHLLFSNPPKTFDVP